MATLASVARARKGQLKGLMTASRRLDAAQEALEREIKRIVVRKQRVPELEDAQRLIGLQTAVAKELSTMNDILGQLSKAWATV